MADVILRMPCHVRIEVASVGALESGPMHGYGAWAHGWLPGGLLISDMHYVTPENRDRLVFTGYRVLTWDQLIDCRIWYGLPAKAYFLEQEHANLAAPDVTH